ncbi:MAG: GFA family protein [Hyphomonadaceae bacterium]|nr:GFA family protein [Hyphomonadaceae bacterium]
MTRNLEGGCSCGAVRYRLKTAPMFVHCCHCMQCQRATGSAFVLNALVETDHVDVLQGDIEVTRGPSESGRPHDIHRCATCHTALWSDYGRRKVMIFLRVGTLDDPAALPPDVHIFTRSKARWFDLPADAKAFDIYYDMKALWPPESLARRRALLGDV